MPHLLRILHVHDAHIRLVLLRHFSKYVAEIPKHLLGDVVLPEVSEGVVPQGKSLCSVRLLSSGGAEVSVLKNVFL